MERAPYFCAIQRSSTPVDAGVVAVVVVVIIQGIAVKRRWSALLRYGGGGTRLLLKTGDTGAHGLDGSGNIQVQMEGRHIPLGVCNVDGNSSREVKEGKAVQGFDGDDANRCSRRAIA